MPVAYRIDSQTIAGLLGGFVNVDLAFATLVGPATMTRLDLRLTDAPSSGTVTVMVNTVSGGGGSDLLSGTILDGTKFISVTGSIAITGTTTLYLRVTAESGNAFGLSASVEISNAEAVTVLLSTLQLVKDSAGITGSTNDAIILRHLEGVSEGMRNWMRHNITSEVITEERHFTSGLNSGIALDKRPIISVQEVRSSGTILATNTYRTEQDSILRKVSGEFRQTWAQGSEIEVDYTAGYAAVPSDIVDACTQEAVRRFLQTKAGKGPGAHVSGLSPESGDSKTLIVDGFMPQTIQAMKPFRRIF